MNYRQTFESNKDKSLVRAIAEDILPYIQKIKDETGIYTVGEFENLMSDRNGDIGLTDEVISELVDMGFEFDEDQDSNDSEPDSFEGYPGMKYSLNEKGAKLSSKKSTYFKGLNPDQKSKKQAQMKRQAKMSDSDSTAYKPMAGDLDKDGKFKGSKVKSSYTKKVNSDLSETKVFKFSEWMQVNESGPADTSLKAKAKKYKMPFGILKQVFNRGMAAWKTGHRPGQSQQAWAHARVNSFVTKSSGTWGKADKDLAQKVRASKKG